MMNASREIRETNELRDILQSNDGPTNETILDSDSKQVSAEQSEYNDREEEHETRNATKSVLPFSMHIMKQMSFLVHNCADCSNGTHGVSGMEDKNKAAYNASLGEYEASELKLSTTSSIVSPMLIGPMLHGGVNGPQEQAMLEQIISEYIQACRFYGCGDRLNSGILTTLRFSLPSMRVRGSFHDADMLALCEILLKYANGPLRYIKRLDFSIVATKAATAQNVGRTPGFASHGAFTLSKVLLSTKYIHEVFLDHNPIGPYGSTAIFVACSQNPTIQRLGIRGCRIRERGALAFAEFICLCPQAGIIEADISNNRIGYRGCVTIEKAIIERSKNQKLPPLTIDMEANLVFQEIMNSVTHGLGVVLAFIGASMLSSRVQGLSDRHFWSCAVYSTSLVVLYTSSTLYHSFFSLRTPRQIFQVMDKSAIYVLIAGSYTPFLQIVLAHEPLWSTYLLGFLWTCCIMGIWVEFAYPEWHYLGYFSLTMYLAMGWSCVVCLPEIATILPEIIPWFFFGGVAYTGGVPFFVRSDSKLLTKICISLAFFLSKKYLLVANFVYLRSRSCHMASFCPCW